MIKTKSINLLMVALLLTSILSGCFLFYITGEETKLSETITVSVDGVLNETLTVEDLEINPGEEREWNIFLKSHVGGEFETSVSFEELADNGLKQFVDVAVYYNDQTVYDGTLTDLLSGNTVSFNNELDESNSNVLKIIFKMPIETGNEAQNTTADFYVKVEIAK